MLANNVFRGSNPGVLWWIAAALMALNLLNLVAWSAGFYVHPAFYLIGIAAVVLAWRSSNAWVLTIILVIFVMMTLGTSIIAWDARSIWFFHGKRIFIDTNLYSQLDKYPGWSHADYPVLVPALAASVAKAFGYWNETLPKLSVVLVLSPILALFAWAFGSAAIFNLWIAAVVLISGAMLLNGYMDAILALYCAAACVVITMRYHCNADEFSGNRQFHLHAIFALLLGNILLLKNEGLLAALMLWICWIPQFYRHRFRAIAIYLCISFAPFIFYFLIWKLALIQNRITGDTFLPGISTRLFARVQNFEEMRELLMVFGKISGAYVIALAIILLFAIRRKVALSILPAVIFIGGYWSALLAIYIITPHPFSWILATSADRTWMVANLCVVALGLYTVGLRHGDEIAPTNPGNSR